MRLEDLQELIRFTKNGTFIKKDDCSLDFISEDGHTINIYRNICGTLELSDNIGTIFLCSESENHDIKTVLDYMEKASKLFIILNHI